MTFNDNNLKLKDNFKADLNNYIFFISAFSASFMDGTCFHYEKINHSALELVLEHVIFTLLWWLLFLFLYCIAGSFFITIEKNNLSK